MIDWTEWTENLFGTSLQKIFVLVFLVFHTPKTAVFSLHRHNHFLLIVDKLFCLTVWGKFHAKSWNCIHPFLRSQCWWFIFCRILHLKFAEIILVESSSRSEALFHPLIDRHWWMFLLSFDFVVQLSTFFWSFLFLFFSIQHLTSWELLVQSRGR